MDFGSFGWRWGILHVLCELIAWVRACVQQRVMVTLAVTVLVILLPVVIMKAQHCENAWGHRGALLFCHVC